MQLKALAFLLVLVMLLAGCTPEATTLPSLSDSGQTSTAVISPENTSISLCVSPSQSLKDSDENKILPLNEPWYDWKTEGVNSLNLAFGGFVTGDDMYLYFVPDYNDDNATGNLYKANLDGSERVLLDSGCKGNLIIEDNKLYYLKDDGVYYINTDGSDKSEIIKGGIDCLYIFDKCMFIMPRNKSWKSLNKDITVKKLKNFHAPYVEYYIFSNDFLYYMDTDEGDVATIISYNIKTGKKMDIINLSGIPVIYNGVLYYYNDDNEYIEAYNINKRKSEKLYIPGTGIPSLMAYYDNYLINTSENCIYNTNNGDVFSYEDIDILAVYSTPIAAYALLDDGWYRFDINDRKLILEPLKD